MVLNDNFVSLFKECGVVLDSGINPNIALIQNKFVVGHLSSLMIEALEYDCFPIFMEIGIKQLYPDLVALSSAMKFETKKEWLSYKKEKANITEAEIVNKIDLRNKSRVNKDYKEADNIRNFLLDKGVLIEDKDGKTIWKFK